MVVLAGVLMLANGIAQADVNMAFVTVGNPGNAADPSTGYGAVPYTYQMGKYDVTLGQYTTFLNAVAQTDTYGLYGSGMSTNYSNIKITQSGNSGSYSYSVTGSDPQAANCPVFDVTWGDAARFCNWLQNNQPTGAEGPGTTETGAYTLNGATSRPALMAITRNAGAVDFIPSEDEWYKAAYYNPSNASYWLYPTQSNTAPSHRLSATGTNNANFSNGGYTDPTNYLTPVGAFAASPGPYGTYDMGGDVWQWNEANISGLERGVRGGSWIYDSDNLAASARGSLHPAAEIDFMGFRVASSEAVPEPGSITLVVCGGLCLLAYVWRRRAA
jgi:formylglycine-generating enzyme required for sulfatase activity